MIFFRNGGNITANKDFEEDTVTTICFDIAHESITTRAFAKVPSLQLPYYVFQPKVDHLFALLHESYSRLTCEISKEKKSCKQE